MKKFAIIVIILSTLTELFALSPRDILGQWEYETMDVSTSILIKDDGTILAVYSENASDTAVPSFEVVQVMWGVYEFQFDLLSVTWWEIDIESVMNNEPVALHEEPILEVFGLSGTRPFRYLIIDGALYQKRKPSE